MLVFFSDNEKVPTHAMTMGIDTICKAKKCFLLAIGENKAEVIAKTLFGPKTATIPATALKDHPNVIFFLDLLAASSFQKTHSSYARFFGKNAGTQDQQVTSELSQQF